MITILTILAVSVSFSTSTSPTSSSSLCSTLSRCSRPLGLETGELPDSSLTASSSYSRSVEARLGRLNREEGGGAWCPASVLTNTSREWLQVEVGREVLVTGVISQGRWDRGLGQEWAEQLRVQYWSYGLWVGEGETRRANTDTFTPVVVRLGEEDSVGVVTDKIRVIPVSEYPRTVCLRLELCGCELKDGQHQHSWQEVHDEVHDEVQEGVHYIRDEVSLQPREEDSLSPNMIVIGVLVTIIMVLTTVIIFILYKNSLLTNPVQQSPTISTHKHFPEPPDLDEYSEYSRPLLGYQQKILWDLSLPPPPPPRHEIVSGKFSCI